MIVKAEIVNQPFSGHFRKIIYDNDSQWNSDQWTFIKFTDSDHFEWIGQFRGFPKKVKVSEKRSETMVLTSDYIYRLNSGTKERIELDNDSPYHNLTVAPSGEFILADNYNIEIMANSLKNKKKIEGPFDMDSIEFREWKGSNLVFTCEEIPGWEKKYIFELDTVDWRIKTPHNIKNNA